MACSCGLKRTETRKTVVRKPTSTTRNVLRKTGKRLPKRPLR